MISFKNMKNKVLEDWNILQKDSEKKYVTLHSYQKEAIGKMQNYSGVQIKEVDIMLE